MSGPFCDASSARQSKSLTVHSAKQSPLRPRGQEPAAVSPLAKWGITICDVEVNAPVLSFERKKTAERGWWVERVDGSLWLEKCLCHWIRHNANAHLL